MGMTDAEVVRQLRLEAGYSEYSDEELAAACLRGAEAIEEVARLRAALEMQFAAVPVGWSWAEWLVERERIARAALSGERKGE
jgi:hypothetical protein